MPRATNNPASRKRRNKVLKRAKGFFLGRKRFRQAKETVKRAERFATRDRKAKKQDFRSLWTVRINAACRHHEISYSRFINGLKKSNVEIDRKILAELAISDISAFAKLVEVAKLAKAA